MTTNISNSGSAMTGGDLSRQGNRAEIVGAKETFLRHFHEKDEGRTTPWSERCDTYMYLAQFRIAGSDVDYATLNAVAGYATSFAYAPRPEDRWNVHYAPLPGRDDRIAHATGLVHRWEQFGEQEAYWETLKATIDAGQAVHAPYMENVLFYGYEDAPTPAARKILPVAIVFVDEEEWTWERFGEWYDQGMVNGWLGRIVGRIDPWPARDSIREVLEVLVPVAGGDDPRRQGDDGVVWGIDGIDAFADDLDDLSKSGAQEGQGGWFQGGWRGCHNLQPQMSGRPSAATWLRRSAGQVGDDAAKHLLAAADAYDEATAAWRRFDRTLGRTIEGMEHLDAWQGEAPRHAGAEAVRTAATHERRGLDAMAAALTAIG